MKYTLHCFAQSGNAYKAALMLNLCSAHWTPRFVDFFGGETRTDEYRALNEMGEVPLLEVGELKLSQSGVILDYLADRFELYDADSVPEHREILRWLLFDNHKLTGNLSTLRFLRHFARTGETDVTRFLHERTIKALAILEKRVEQHSFVIGDRATIADVSLCGYLFFADEAQLDWTDFPAVEAWLQRIRSLPGWAHPYDLMPGHDRSPAAGGNDAVTSAAAEDTLASSEP